MEDKTKIVDTNNVDTTTGQATDQTNKDNGVDYKAELEKVHKQLKQAEFNIVNLKKGSEDDGEEKVDENDIKQLLAKEREESHRKFEELQKDLTQDNFQEVLKQLSNDPNEQQLMEHHYNNSIVKSGFTKQAFLTDLKRAKILSNEPKFEKMISELNKTTVANTTMSTGAASGYSVDDAVETKLSQKDEEMVKKLSVAHNVSVEVVKQKLLDNKKNYKQGNFN